MTQVVYLASNNQHKCIELQRLAQADICRIKLRSASSLGGMPAVVEDAGTFEGNALKKAKALASVIKDNSWALSDDSGICVDALDGLPGVESAYFAGPNATGMQNLKKLEYVMRGKTNRTAHYVCVFCLVTKNGVFYFREACSGVLAEIAVGTNGFGYDPLFIPDGFKETLGQLSVAVKESLSHRAKAWRNLVKWSNGNIPNT